jgi:6-phosphogluconate dehydrogenase
MKKIIGIIGLGKMGYNISLNLLSKKWKVVAYNRSKDSINKLKQHGGTPSYSVKELTEKLPNQKIIILSIPQGKPVNQTIKLLSPLLKKGDIIIDSGNSLYKDSVRRNSTLSKKGIHYFDMGTSGGTEGARHGASLMIGGDKKIFDKIEPLFKDMAIKNGYAYLGPSGAGHFVKIIHNGIEYAILEAYAEGLQVLDKSKYKYKYKDVLRVWNNGSIIRSYITELAEKVFQKDPNLSSSPGIIGGNDTGKWAYRAAKENKTEFKTLKHAIDKRKLSKSKQSFSTKFISLIRNAFGGHPIEKK